MRPSTPGTSENMHSHHVCLPVLPSTSPCALQTYNLLDLAHSNAQPKDFRDFLLAISDNWTKFLVADFKAKNPGSTNAAVAAMLCARKVAAVEEWHPAFKLENREEKALQRAITKIETIMVRAPSALL